MVTRRTPLGWLVGEVHQAEAAGVDLELDEVVYVLQVRDLADTYRDFISENPDAPEDETAWEDLTAEHKAGLIDLAIRCVENLDFPWTDAFQRAILDHQEGQ